MKLKILLYLFLIFSNFYPLNNSIALASEKNINSKFSKEITNSYTKNNIQTDYLIGPGDKISITFAGLDIYTDLYTVDTNGYLDLPEINKLFVDQLTLEELNSILLERYKDFIISPDIKLKIVYFRPVKVFIKGEVRQPGLYSLEYEKEGSSFTSTNNYQFNVYRCPTVFDALKLSNGISNYADLSRIEIIRKNSKSQGGGKISTNLDFLSLLNDGNQDFNIDLRDGDIISVPKNKKILKDQILSINKSNLTPNKIFIYVSGNVNVPGALEIEQGSSLVQALYLAGGEKYFTGRINHIRFNEEGDSEKQSFSFDPNAPAKSKKNPILLHGDIINVNRTIIGKTTNAILQIAPPLFTTNAIFNIFD